jgi:hypothetical protein
VADHRRHKLGLVDVIPEDVHTGTIFLKLAFAALPAPGVLVHDTVQNACGNRFDRVSGMSLTQVNLEVRLFHHSCVRSLACFCADAAIAFPFLDFLGGLCCPIILFVLCQRCSCSMLSWNPRQRINLVVIYLGIFSVSR